MGPTQRVLSGFVKNPRHPNVRRGQTGQPRVCIWRAKSSLLRTKMARDSTLNVPKKKKKKWENDHSLHRNSRVSGAETYYDPALWLNSTRHLKWFPQWEARDCGRCEDVWASVSQANFSISGLSNCPWSLCNSALQGRYQWREDQASTTKRGLN